MGKRFPEKHFQQDDRNLRGSLPYALRMLGSIRRRLFSLALGIAAGVCTAPLASAVELGEGQSATTVDRFMADQMQRSVIPGATVR